MAPIFQNAHLDYEIEVHHLPEEVRQVIFLASQDALEVMLVSQSVTDAKNRVD